MARFSNAAKWDPGVLSSEDTDPGPPRYGSTYRLVVGALGGAFRSSTGSRRSTRRGAVVLQAENSVIRSTDVIEVSPAPGGGLDSDLRGHDPHERSSRPVDPACSASALRRIGDRAAAGLKAALAA